MAENSKIQWTHHTFNLWIGCTKVSPGCAFCYAEAWDKRMFAGANWGPGAPRKKMADSYWRKPLKWEKDAKKAGSRFRIFCSSLADVFDSEGLAAERARLWELIKKTPSLDWLLLTKRPENAPDMLPEDWGDGYDNVWFGTTAEDQVRANERIEALRKVKAKTKFLSVEPQLEEIDFSRWLSEPTAPFDWMIFGGESGDSARPFDPEWIRKSLDQAKAAGVKRFVKQMGTVWAKANGELDKKKGGAKEDWPPWLDVREFPESKVVA